ncbi:MAG TPA: type II toxin-antitoxin system VapC family toxin [Brevundimonas sp.]
MIVDTSALIAIIFDEPEASDLLAVLMSGRCRMSAATCFETGMVIDRKAENGFRAEAFKELLVLAEIEIVPFGEDQIRLARSAYAEFGKGRHRARLNFGDCFTYALAKETGEPLLFKGNDFSQTDIISAV